LLVIIAGIALALKAQDADSNRPDEDQKARIRRATQHIKEIEMRLTDSEKDAYQHAAKRAGVTLSEWIRDRLNRAAKRENRSGPSG
jgi:hypothetical protein